MAYNPYTGTTPTYRTGTPTGGAPTTGSGTKYGLIPDAPPYTTDVTQTIGTNAYPQLSAILGSGYQVGLDKEMANIQAQLSGQVPQDVINVLGQQGAERGIAMGSPGAPNANAAYLRALGLTSIGQQQQGLQNLSSVIQQVPIQPTQTGTQTTDLSLLKAQYAAAPDPRLAAEQALRNAQTGIAAGRGSVGMPAASPTSAPAYQGGAIADPAMESYWALLNRANAAPGYNPSQDYMNSLYAGLPGMGAGGENDPVWESLFGYDPSMYGVNNDEGVNYNEFENLF